MPNFDATALDKRILAFVALITAILFVILIWPSQILNEQYSFSFGQTVLEKSVLITPNQHVEQFTVTNPADNALIVVIPKELAENASDIEAISHAAKLKILEFDPILKFSKIPGEELSAKLEFRSSGKNICTTAALFPDTYIDDISDSQLSELKESLLEYGALSLDCSQVNETEQDLATELEAVFQEVELQPPHPLQ